MDRNRSWSALIVSNVLLTVPVMVCFMILGWICGDAAAWVVDAREDQFPEVLRAAQNTRGLSVAIFLVAGFVISQVSFVIRTSKQKEAPAPLWPFQLRFSLLSCVLVMFAGAALVWLIVHERTFAEQASFTQTGRGWPFVYLLSNIWTKSSPTAIDSGGENSFTWTQSNLYLDIFFCAVLLFIVLIVIEFFLSMRKSNRTAISQSAATPVIDAEQRPH